MTLDAAAILGDPVFQLNVTLWMLQPAPPGAPIRPVLRDVGYLLSALSRELPVDRRSSSSRSRAISARALASASISNDLASSPISPAWMSEIACSTRFSSSGAG